MQNLEKTQQNRKKLRDCENRHTQTISHLPRIAKKRIYQNLRKKEYWIAKTKKEIQKKFFPKKSWIEVSEWWKSVNKKYNKFCKYLLIKFWVTFFIIRLISLFIRSNTTYPNLTASKIKLVYSKTAYVTPTHHHHRYDLPTSKWTTARHILAVV